LPERVAIVDALAREYVRHSVRRQRGDHARTGSDDCAFGTGAAHGTEMAMVFVLGRGRIVMRVEV